MKVVLHLVAAVTPEVEKVQQPRLDNAGTEVSMDRWHVCSPN